MAENVLFYIDTSPIEQNIADYFTQFGYSVLQKKPLKTLGKESKHIAAILIKCTAQMNVSSIKKLYGPYAVPIIIISEEKDKELCIKFLEAGADDFLVKPFHPRELHARINVINKRLYRSFENYDHEKEVLRFANWRMYPSSRQIFYEETELFLSTKEYDLLLAFVRQPQKALSRNFLLQITKNQDIQPLNRRIDVQISRLRQKIEVGKDQPQLIRTVRHGGYLFSAEVIRSKE